MPCVQVFVTQQYLAIAMEYAAGGDMFEHVVRKGGLKESEARWFFQQLLVGVDYVHRMVSFRSSSKQWLLTCGESQGQHQQLVLPGLMLTPQSHKLLLEVVSVELAAIMVSASGMTSVRYLVHILAKPIIYHTPLQGVANRDIKLENTLLDGSPRPLLKICDFGYSKVCALRCTPAALQLPSPTHTVAYVVLCSHRVCCCSMKSFNRRLAHE